jgi:hypothetical protein
MIQIQIKSRPGTYTTIPDDVAEAAKGYSWCVKSNGYVVAYERGSGRKNQKFIRLHHLVFYVMTGKWPEKGQEVDHINHDKLDNRMENLHVGSKSDNNKNRNKQEGTSSQFQGVFWNKKGQKWYAQAGVRIDGKLHIVLSSYTDDETLAAKCADCIRDLVGGWVPRNYPDRPFLSKWGEIGSKQRAQILNSMNRHKIVVCDWSLFEGWKLAA